MPYYLTWRELRALLEKVMDNRLLDEPVLFTHLDAYGDNAAYPVQLLNESRHPGEQRVLSYDEHNDEYAFGTQAHPHLLRQVPPSALYLHFSEMDDDQDERTKWLAKPNPHTPPPAPAEPGPAPLFE